MKNDEKPSFTTNKISSISGSQTRLQIEMICSACSNNNCAQHESTRIITDKETGLEFEADCSCTNHGSYIKEKKELKE